MSPGDPRPRPRREAAALTVFYDGSCGLCQAAVAWAVARDREHALEPIPFQSEEARARLGPERARRAEDELHVWSRAEGVRTGADAVAAMLARIPGWRWAGRALAWWPVRMVARPVYRWIAARRSSWRTCSRPLGGAQR